MRTFRTVVLFLLIATSAAAQHRRRAIGSPFPIGACFPGNVASAPGITDFVVSNGQVFWGDFDGNIWRVPREGAITPTPIASAPGTQILWIDADATKVYFATFGDGVTADFYSVSRNGGTPTLITGNVLTPGAITSDSQFIYWASLGTPAGEDFLPDGSVGRVAKTGGAVQTLASNLSFPFCIAVFGGNVYYGETGIAIGNTSAGVRRVPAGGGTVVKLFDGAPVGDVAIDATSIYFTVFRLGTGLIDIDRMPIGGGSVTPLVPNLDFAAGLALQGSSLYYIADIGESESLYAVNVAGGTPRVILAGEAATSRIAFDECLVYSTNVNEAIVRSFR